MEEENKDTIEKNETVEISEANNEEIKIADDVVSVIAGKAVSEISGVAGMAGGFAGGISEVLSGKKNLSKGIKVDVEEKEETPKNSGERNTTMISKNKIKYIKSLRVRPLLP